MTLNLETADLAEIAELYQAPASTWVRTNMIMSIDGQFAGSTGSSRDLTSPDDLRLLLLLRALSDVVLVGASTARQENYRQPKLRPEFAFLDRPAPRLAVVSASLEFDLSAPLFHGGAHKTIVLNAGPKSPSAELKEIAEVIEIDPDQVANQSIEKLSELGLTKVTCEGGPRLLSQLLANNCVDEYDLTIAPLIVDSDSGLTPIGLVESQWRLASEAQAGSYVYLRYLRQ